MAETDLTARIIDAMIAPRLASAREKHPLFASSSEHAVRVVRSEMLEWEAQAMLAGDSPARLRKAEAEALDVIVVLLRWLAREYSPAAKGI
jgi:hypothetical protein